MAVRSFVSSPWKGAVLATLRELPSPHGRFMGPSRKAPDPEAAQEGENPDAIRVLTSLSGVGPRMPGRREEAPGNEQVQGA